jgi:hypothetical protein
MIAVRNYIYILFSLDADDMNACKELNIMWMRKCKPNGVDAWMIQCKHVVVCKKIKI